MRKKILCLAALSCFGSVAHAQSNVTLYGLIDSGFMSDRLDGRGTVNGINSGIGAQSRWGIRGSESMGNGLTAKFWLESGMTIDNGTSTQGRLFGRQALVALESADFGEISLGRQQNLAYRWATPILTPFGASWSRSAASTAFAYNDNDYGDDGRLNNSAFYTSPKILGGLELGAGYSFSAIDTEVAGSANNTRVANAGLRYTKGNLVAAATYMNANPAAGRKNSSLATIAATYDFGMFAVNAGLEKSKNPLSDPDGANFATGFVSTGHTSDVGYSIGASAPVGGGRVLASYMGTSKSEIDSYNLGYYYNLSKRTHVYALLNKTETRDFVASNDRSRRQMGVGLQHRF